MSCAYEADLSLAAGHIPDYNSGDVTMCAGLAGHRGRSVEEPENNRNRPVGPIRGTQIRPARIIRDSPKHTTLLKPEQVQRGDDSARVHGSSGRVEGGCGGRLCRLPPRQHEAPKPVLPTWAGLFFAVAHPDLGPRPRVAIRFSEAPAASPQIRITTLPFVLVNDTPICGRYVVGRKGDRPIQAECACLSAVGGRASSTHGLWTRVRPFASVRPNSRPWPERNFPKPRVVDQGYCSRAAR